MGTWIRTVNGIEFVEVAYTPQGIMYFTGKAKNDKKVWINGYVHNQNR